MTSTNTYTPPANGFKTFLVVWVTQSISVLGSALTFFALTIWLAEVLYPNPEQKGQLAIALSLVSLAYGLPNIFSAPLAGALADRHDRRSIMLLMDFASGLISLALTFLILAHLLNLWLLIGLVVIQSIVSAFHYSAFDSSYAMLVPERLLPRANGMMQTMSSLSNVLAPAIAASMIALPALSRQGKLFGEVGRILATLQSGIPLAVGVDALTFFVAAGILLFLFIPSPHRADLQPTADQAKKSIWADIVEGLMYIWNRRPLLWLLGTFTMINFASGVFVLQPLFVKFNLAADWSGRGFTLETALALLGTVSGIGGVAGGVLISLWGGLKKRRIYGVIVPIVIALASMIVYGLSPWLYLTAAAGCLFDGLLPAMNAHSQAIWQTQTPLHLQGRVFAVRRLIAQFSWPLGVALFGWLGASINVAWLFAGMGLVGAIFCAAQLFNPDLLKIEDKAYLDKLAEGKGDPAAYRD
jgi:DHA3 family macrolide efflux protein-like MFS transporter